MSDETNSKSEESDQKTWNGKHVYKVSNHHEPQIVDEVTDPEIKRNEIEPWLTALFQSEHLSLLLGSGITTAAVELAAGKKPEPGMVKIEFTEFKEQLDKASQESAESAGRGAANIEDQIRVCNDLIKGLEIYTSTNIYGSKKLKRKLHNLKNELIEGLTSFSNNVLKSEKSIFYSKHSELAAERLLNFLVSFASRSATRERLNIFTTNYDRIIEYSSELAGIRLIDRFVGIINPVFRASRVEVDMHYNPPGIRGEPRYLEGVAHFTKLHGSLDWQMANGVVRRVALPYGASDINKYLDENASLMIYPNETKDRETTEYPYVELFRDFAAQVCRPNSTLVIYGYSFGDDHINRVIRDMLAIPSTHLVIISYNDEGDRIKKFYDSVKRSAQISLLIGPHFGYFANLVDYYMPKPAIDRTTIKMTDIMKARGNIPDSGTKEQTESRTS